MASSMPYKPENQVAKITDGGGDRSSYSEVLFSMWSPSHYRRHHRGERAQDKLRDLFEQRRAHYRKCDVAAKEEDIVSTMDFAVEKFGKLDIMLNNARLVTGPDTFQVLISKNIIGQP